MDELSKKFGERAEKAVFHRKYFPGPVHFVQGKNGEISVAPTPIQTAAFPLQRGS
jgi:hypothetical protein